MRNLLLFILLSASSVWAKNGLAQETHLTLELKNVALEQVFEEIRRQGRIEFIYNTGVVDVNEKVSVSKHNCPLSEILNEVLGDKYVYLIQGSVYNDPAKRSGYSSETGENQRVKRKGAGYPWRTLAWGYGCDKRVYSRSFYRPERRI